MDGKNLRWATGWRVSEMSAPIRRKGQKGENREIRYLAYSLWLGPFVSASVHLTENTLKWRHSLQPSNDDQCFDTPEAAMLHCQEALVDIAQHALDWLSRSSDFYAEEIRAGRLGPGDARTLAGLPPIGPSDEPAAR